LKLFAEGEEAKELFASLAKELAAIVRRGQLKTNARPVASVSVT
jgi:hypothetical protein